jgi:PAS domain S-box-containing protein
MHEETTVRRRQNGSSRARPRPRGPRVNAHGGALVEAVMAAADGGFITNPDGCIILWNGAAEAILGYARDDLLGRRCHDLFGRNDVNGDGSHHNCATQGHARRGDAMPTFDVRMRTKAGSSIWLNVSLLRFRDESDDAPRVLHLFRDVTFTRLPLVPMHDRLAANSPNHNSGALTHRECEVLSLIGEGLNTAVIAKRLHLSWSTVRNHAQNILVKLNVHSRLEAVAYARRHRLL